MTRAPAEFDRAGAVRAVAEGTTLTDAAARFGTGYTAIYLEVQRHGGVAALRAPLAKPPTGPRRRIDHDLVEALYKEDVPRAEIASRVGGAESTVEYILARRQVERRRQRRGDLSGQRFGELLVERAAGATSYGDSLWLCLCDCGGRRVVNRAQLERAKFPARRCRECSDARRSRRAA